MSGRGRPRDPILEEMRWMYPDVSERTLFRWKAELMAEAAEMTDATPEQKLAFIREHLIPSAA